ncbi:MAG: glycosyltransferase, partial [Proteobacteria bacterium]
IMVRKNVFEAVDGFDAINTPISHSDVDLCFKIRESGWSCVYTPFATLTHIGHMSRETQDFESGEQKFKKDPSDIYLLKRWAAMCAYDPYFPPEVRDMIYIDSQEPYQLYIGDRPSDRGGKSALILSHDLTQSGAPRVVLDLADALSKQGYFVCVMSPSDGPLRFELTAAGVDVIIEPLLLREHDSVRDLASNFDLVVANTVVTWPAVKQISPFTDVYWYIHETGLIDQIAAEQPGFLPSFNKVKGVWAGSDRAMEKLRAHGIDGTIVEYGVDMIAREHGSSAAHSDQLIVSCFGSFEPRKGQDLALLGFLELPVDLREQVILQFSGRILHHEYAEILREKAKDEPNVRFLGDLSFEEYRDALQGSHVVICPSRDDTLPLVSLHALAAKKALLVSAATGTSAYLDDGVSGMILTNNSPSEISEILQELARNKRRVDEIGEGGFAVYSQYFSRLAFQDRIHSMIRLHG